MPITMNMWGERIDQFQHPPWTNEGRIERSNYRLQETLPPLEGGSGGTQGFYGSMSAERAHKRISSYYSSRLHAQAEEDLIPDLYLSPLSEDEINDIHDMSNNKWDAIVMTAIKIREKII